MILYANSCSYGVLSTGKTYVDFIGEQINTNQIINAGLAGSCNTRILRTSTRDLLELKESDSDNDIVACISLGALYRSELWDETKPAIKNDGHFRSFQISSIDKNKFDPPNKLNYAKEWFKTYNDEAEITNTYFLLNLFISFLETNNIRYLIWAGAMNYKPVDVTTPFLATLYNTVNKNPRVLNLFDFSFSNYCSIIKGHIPYDHDQYGIYGHHSEEAHRDFAEFILPKL